MKEKPKCKTPSKAQVNYRKHQRTKMNRAIRRDGERFKKTLDFGQN
jgi:hypothetical protein